ncbi:MAG: DUF882 domain-containing protein [Acidobacteria bacterium]|jgi:uncharacterized protein YcbK (DUF882 family)|nr:MAG: DUF882 domain-containing protein [Acidobacteriota bacterium]
MTRRSFIRTFGLLTLLGKASLLRGSELFGLSKGARILKLYSVNTGESLKIAYWVDGEYLHSSLREINYLLRDYRSGDVHPIDLRLLDMLYLITRLAEKDNIYVISGYRSTETNYYLHKTKGGVAKNSYHTLGRAIDIRIADMEIKSLRDLAISLRFGGVGYYPKSGFVHLDTGPFRYW